MDLITILSAYLKALMPNLKKQLSSKHFTASLKYINFIDSAR